MEREIKKALSDLKKAGESTQELADRIEFSILLDDYQGNRRKVINILNNIKKSVEVIDKINDNISNIVYK